MDIENENKTGTGFLHRDRSPVTLKEETGSNCEEKKEIREVDDKLIGDDLDIKEALGGCGDKEKQPGINENNY